MNSPKATRFRPILAATLLGTGALIVGCGQPVEPTPAPVPSVTNTNTMHEATNAVPTPETPASNGK